MLKQTQFIKREHYKIRHRIHTRNYITTWVTFPIDGLWGFRTRTHHGIMDALEEAHRHNPDIPCYRTRRFEHLTRRELGKLKRITGLKSIADLRLFIEGGIVS